MANNNTPFGLKPIKNLLGAPWNGRTMMVQIAAGYNQALGVGDAVIWVGTAEAGGHYPTVQLATAGSTNKILGVIVGFEPAFGTTPNLNLNYHLAQTDQYAYIVLATDAIFEIQASADAVIGATISGLNANLIYTNAVNTVTGLSGAELDTATTPSADATKQLTIIGAVDRADNDIASVNSKWLVTINLPSLFPGIAGV
jgi:hypothetical protein